MDDFFKVDEAQLSFERFDGTMTPKVRRLVMERGDAVAALVLERDTERLLFPEQFRFPTLEKGPGWLLEVMAGMVEPGELPEVTLRRELTEELGYQIRSVTSITLRRSTCPPAAHRSASGSTTRK